MKMSIIIPVYNAEKTLKYCLDSILNQPTELEIEVILVEDYSTDYSYEICCELQAKHTEIRLYRTVGKGVSAARNTGLLYASGDIVGFCDADDTYEANIFEKIKLYFENKETDFVIGGFYYSKVDNQKTVTLEIHSHKKEKRVKGHLLYNMLLNDGRILGSVCNKFYRSESIKNIYFSTELDYCEDLVFNAKLVEYNNLNAVIVGYPVYHYTINSESATNDKDRLFTEDARLKYIVSLEKLLTETSDTKYRIIIEYKIVTLALDFLFHDLVDGKCKYQLKKTVRKYQRGFMKGSIFNISFGSLKWIAKEIIVCIREWGIK